MWTLLLAVGLYVAAPAVSADTVPTWFREHVAFLTHDGGRWIADNAEYRGPNEPWSAYGIVWTLGTSGHMSHGRLFGIADDGSERTFWEFVSYWDSVADQGVVVQISRDGGFGSGVLRPASDSTMELEQTFWSRQGTSRSLHREQRVGDTQDSYSLTWAEDAWQPGRHYVWRHEASR